ncbi:FecR family protein [Pseudoduganella sp. OTU4001]|uniref:FecR family protein n=1 Tax=Pseudoduganella sp. OTU4001 TaxID=3043854 RepID=UPI00313D9E37
MLRLLVAAAGLALLSHGAYAAVAGKIVYVAGKAQVAERPAVLDGDVQEGDMLSTGADGYLYIKTVDNGLFILRPSSQAKIAAYYIDAKSPANNRIKLELLNGVARSRSGDAVKQARQNFRFNTPVAAIGVRGTDFTVFTDHDTTRVTVNSGGIALSGFGGTCTPDGLGPCEGAATRDLFAAQKGNLLQFKRGQVAPQLLPASSTISPDGVAPPRPDEPGKQAGNSMPAQPNLDVQKTANLQVQLANQKPDQPPVVLPPVLPPVVEQPTTPPDEEKPPVVVPPVLPERQIVWGRWQPVLDQAKQVDLTAELKSGKTIIAQNSDFVLMRTQGKEYVIPERGSVAFSLKEGQAFIHPDNAALPILAASLENGSLNFNFDQRTFATKFDLVNGDERLLMQSSGQVASDGRFVGDPTYIKPNNMNVRGLLSAEGSAAYIFERRMTGRTIYGGTSWTAQPVPK